MFGKTTCTPAAQFTRSRPRPPAPPSNGPVGIRAAAPGRHAGLQEHARQVGAGQRPLGGLRLLDRGLLGLRERMDRGFRGPARRRGRRFALEQRAADRRDAGAGAEPEQAGERRSARASRRAAPRITRVSASARSASAREASAPGRSWLSTSAWIERRRTSRRSRSACAAVLACWAASTSRKASPTAFWTSRRVRASSARARVRAASAPATPAPRRPKSNGSHDASAPTALLHALSADGDASTGPEIGEITDCGRSCPKMLLAVARFVCHTESSLGRAAARATRTPASDAATCSIAARTDG